MKLKAFKLFGLTALCALVLTTTITLRAQTESTGGFGIKGGLNVSNFYTNNVNDKNTVIGFNGGVFLKIPITDFFSLQPELLYSQKGAQLKYNTIVTGSGKFQLNYIEVPILAVINVAQNFNIHGGVYGAYLVSANIQNVAGDGTYDFNKELNRDNFETMDYGLTAGLGYDFNKLSVGARYDYGLQTIGKDKSFLGTTYKFPDARNSNIQVYLSLKIL